MNTIEHLRQRRIDEGQTYLIRLQLHKDRKARIAAASKALALCGKLGPSRARLTQKTMVAANRARRVEA